MKEKNSKKEKVLKWIFKFVSIFSISIIAGYFMLVAVYALPLGRIHNNVIKSGNSFTPNYTTLIDGNITTITDDYTDALMLMTAENGTDRNPFTASVYAYYTGRDGMKPNEIIKDLENPENKSVQYSRYWHGYLLFLKPMLMFLDYNEILILTSILVICLIVAVVYLLTKKKLERLIVPYTFTVALMFPIAISLSLQYVSVFALCNLAIIAVLLLYERIIKTRTFFFLFMIIGIITCYFDLLTFPLLTLGIPLTVWLFMENRQKNLKFFGNFKRIVEASVAYGLGYAGIWIAKWTLGSIITGKNIFVDAFGAVENRMSTTTVGEISRFKPIMEAFQYTFTKPVLIIMACAILLTVVLLIMKKIKIDVKKIKENAWLLVIAVMPLVWYMVLANHSSWHMFFTYRTLGIFTFAILSYISFAIDTHKIESGKSLKSLKRRKND